MVGQLRRTAPPTDPPRRVVSDVWGAAVDFRVNLASRFGFKGEVYTGQGLGNYNGGILQSLDAVTWKAIRSTGGWVEGFVYLTPNLHSHTGFVIDDPNNNDLTASPIPSSGGPTTARSTAICSGIWGGDRRSSASGWSLPTVKPTTRTHQPAQPRIRFAAPVPVDLLVPSVRIAASAANSSGFVQTTLIGSEPATAHPGTRLPGEMTSGASRKRANFSRTAAEPVLVAGEHRVGAPPHRGQVRSHRRDSSQLLPPLFRGHQLVAACGAGRRMG